MSCTSFVRICKSARLVKFPSYGIIRSHCLNAVITTSQISLRLFSPLSNQPHLQFSDPVSHFLNVYGSNFVTKKFKQISIIVTT